MTRLAVWLHKVGIHSWETVWRTLANVYQECRVCGKRRVVRLGVGVHQWVDEGWVETGRWTKVGPPPKPPSGVGRMP